MRYTIVEFIHDYLKDKIQEGSNWIDATAGNGFDTLFLCERVGEKGKVLAFDIQKEAVFHTKEKLAQHQLEKRAAVFLDSHCNMNQYVEEESVDGILFNFGYLPNGNHKIATKAVTSIKAIEEGLKLLKRGGIMSLCIYWGKETGFEEKETILSYIKQLGKQYLVIKSEFYNRGNYPPIPVFIWKL